MSEPVKQNMGMLARVSRVTVCAGFRVDGGETDKIARLAPVWNNFLDSLAALEKELNV